MNTIPRLVALCFAALLPLATFAKIERVVEKTFSVQSSGLLTVQTQGGNIQVETGSGSEVRVVAREYIRASSDAEADELLKNLTLRIEAAGNGVNATAKYEKKKSFGLFGGSTPVQVNFVVTVPKDYHVSLRTSGGNVTVADLNGTAHVRTSGGNVTLGNISGEVDANTSGGDVRLAQGGSRVKLGTSGGNITLDHAVGPADLDTSGGDIRVGSVDDTLHASTSGGNVTADKLGAFKGECELRTSGGNVRVTVPKSHGFTLDASTSGGHVSANGLTISITDGGAGRGKLGGDVNGGGPKLRLHSSGGDIVVSTR